MNTVMRNGQVILIEEYNIMILEQRGLKKMPHADGYVKTPYLDKHVTRTLGGYYDKVKV